MRASSSRPFKRTRTGCLTCKKDGYKCDEKKPFCSRCLRLEKDCNYGVKLKWQVPMRPQQIVPTSGGPRQKHQRKNASVSLIGPQLLQHSTASASPRAMSSGIPLHEAYLLHHWKTSLASLITFAPMTQNPFQTYITPMINDSLSLRSAICSMAACHLSVLKDDPALLHTATQHQFNTVSLFRRTVTTESPLISLAIIMILHITDRHFATNPGAVHLGGAKVIKDLAGPIFWNSDAGRFLLGCCTYHDTIVSVSDGTPPIMGLKTNVPYLRWMKPMRLLRNLWVIIGQISSMRSLGRPLLDSEGETIEIALEPIDTLASHEGDEGHTIQAYKEAAYIYLYQVWHSMTSPHPKIVRRAHNCLGHLLQVEVASPLASSHPWPLRTSACEITDSELRCVVRERVKDMYEYRHLPSLRRLGHDIEATWKIKDKEQSCISNEDLDCPPTIT
ncbi:hypothetical protein NPX13_g8180 [Xylaria arbuscula]|uniref:Zn(2)-C6 fungal-type domain-containing protein n=1 Tax=Xylaria arbuscula TaxID=114810 RepID=A0A9W8TJP2_9PEZI|nr:hypothetical protein NPX13_g8180 [Xylaria arbuscula]